MKKCLFLNAKHTFVVLIAVLITTLSFSACGIINGFFGTSADYFSTCYCFKGQWSNWEKHFFRSSMGREYDNNISCSRSIENHIIGLSMKDSGGNVYWSFIITDYEKGRKNFTGIVEYYVNDTYPTAEDLAKANFFVKPDYRTDKTPSVKRTAKAYINIVNEEKKPAVFNVWYDNIGVGISVRDVLWD